MKRRVFIRLSSVGVLIPILGCAPTPEPSSALGQPFSLSFIQDSAAISELGVKYRSLNPDEDRVNKLTRLLLSKKEGGLVDQGDEETLVNFLLEKIKKEYEQEETVVIDGWVLSNTEARQCALFSLTQ